MRRLLATAVLACAVVAAPNEAAADPGEDAGTVALVDPTDTTRAYEHGDSTSAFAIALPTGASCPGDSANDGWRVQSFIVPVATDPATMRFQALRPVSDNSATHRALREVNGTIFTQRMTAPNEGPGEPGRIDPGPALTFAHFEAGTFPPGRYVLGIACTPIDWHVARYWDVEIVFEEAADVSPGGLRWSVVATDQAPVAPGDDGFRLPSWATTVAIAVLVGSALAFWFTRASRGRPHPASANPSIRGTENP